MNKTVLAAFLGIASSTFSFAADPNLLQIQKQVCQVEIYEFENQKIENKVPAGAHATLKSSCSGVIIDKRTFRTDHHCLTEKLGYHPKTNNTFLGRIVCDGGNEVKWFSNGAVDENNLYSKFKGIQAVPYDYITVHSPSDFTQNGVQSATSRAEIQQLLNRDQCVAFGYADKREADGIKPRPIKINIVTRELRQSFTKAGLPDDPNIIYMGYQDVIKSGDSGGPLFCKNSSDQYVLVGNLTAVNPVGIEWGVSKSSVKILLPDGSLFTGDKLFISVATSLSLSIASAREQVASDNLLSKNQAIAAEYIKNHGYSVNSNNYLVDGSNRPLILYPKLAIIIESYLRTMGGDKGAAYDRLGASFAVLYERLSKAGTWMVVSNLATEIAQDPSLVKSRDLYLFK